jgi:hypothetical protein
MTTAKPPTRYGANYRSGGPAWGWAFPALWAAGLYVSGTWIS